jgi:hypothetical protein
MKKLEEIKWRLENRTVAYLLPGCQPDTVAHDDMAFLMECLDILLNADVSETARQIEMVDIMQREIERRHNLLDGILSM